MSLRAPPTALHVRTFVEGVQLRIDAGDLAAGAQADAGRALEAASAIPFDSSTSLYFGHGARRRLAKSRCAAGAARKHVAPCARRSPSIERSVGAEHLRTRRSPAVVGGKLAAKRERDRQYGIWLCAIFSCAALLTDRERKAQQPDKSCSPCTARRHTDLALHFHRRLIGTLATCGGSDVSASKPIW